MRSTARQCVIVLWVAVGLTACGCDAKPGTPAKASAAGPAFTADNGAPPPLGVGDESETPLLSPAQVTSRLGVYHRRRDYQQIAPLIAADGRDATIAFLRAVDKVVDANARLRQVAEQRLGGLGSDAWNLSALKNNLGIFSDQTRLINQTFKGPVAVVTLQEAENVPLVRAKFKWTQGGWKYRAVAPPRAMVPALERLAGILADITASLQQGAGVEDYVRAFVERVWPQMNRVMAARAASEQRVSSVAKAP